MTTEGDGFFQYLTPAEIYHQLTEGSGPDALHRAQQNLYLETPEEEDRADLLASLSDLIDAGWQGEASAAAHGAALPLKEHVRVNAHKLHHAQDLISRQVGSFQTAYNSVRPVSEPPEQSLDDAFPFDTDHDKRVADYQSDAQHNMMVFGQYDGASEYNETNMPQEFHAGGRDGGDVSVKSPDTIEVRERTPGPGDGSPGAGESDGPGNPGGGYPGSSGRYPGSSGDFTGSSGVLPVGGEQTGFNDYRPVPDSSSPVYSPSSATRGAPVPGSEFVGGGPVGGFSGGGGSGGASGGVPRAGGGAAGGPAVRGPGGAVGAGALAAEENAVRRGMQGAAARGGAGPMGAPVGAGRGKDDEDAEHERKVLIKADSEATFGSDELTAPQVIGDDEYED